MRRGIITTTNPVSCSYIIRLYTDILTHDARVFCAFLSLKLFFLLYRARALQCHSITNGSRPLPRSRRGTARGNVSCCRNSLKLSSATASRAYFHYTCRVRVSSARSLRPERPGAPCGRSAHVTRTTQSARNRCRAHGSFPRSLITFSDFRQIYE